MSNESWPTHGPDFNAWNSDFDKFSALLHSVKEEAWWVCDHGLKYLNIRIDTRDNGFLLLSDAEDGKRTRISPDRVIAAIEKYLDMFPTRRAALSVPAAAVVGEPVAWAFRNNGDDMWLFARDEPEICYEKQPLYAAPFNQRTEVEPAWWIVTTDMGKVIFHGPDKDRADRVAAIHGREAQPLYAAHPWPDGYVRGHLHLIRCFADDMTERNWEDKRLYIKQQVDFIVSALGGASHD